MIPCPHETFPALAGVTHAFTHRVPDVDVLADRETVLGRLSSAHEALRHHLGVGERVFRTAEQVHGNGVARVDSTSPEKSAGVDALITDDPRVCLGIYVADCGPIWIFDPVRRAIGCVHSGKKGTELEIVAATVAKMTAEFGSAPRDLVAQLGPCIRPPHYEIDFAATIRRQCAELGIGTVQDSGACTASAPERYYSYRRELGRTGRMVALLALA